MLNSSSLPYVSQQRWKEIPNMTENFLVVIPVTLYMETLNLPCAAFPFYQEDYKKL